jgi:hypothetical protein
MLIYKRFDVGVYVVFADFEERVERRYLRKRDMGMCVGVHTEKDLQNRYD